MSPEETAESYRQTCDDEIDLVQLLQILVKRKWVIVGFTLFCLLVGGAYAFLSSANYKYTTTLQVGTILVEGKDSVERASIESASSVKLKLEKVYIPTAISQLSSRYAGRLADATVKEQKNSSILLIESTGSVADGKLFKELHTMIVSTLIENHREEISVLKRQYEILADRASLTLKDLENPKIYGVHEKKLQRQIEMGKMELAQFDAENSLMLAKKTGIKKTEKLLQKQISQIAENLKLSYEKRATAISETDDATKAMTFLLLNAEIQKNEQELATLKERLYVSLGNEKQNLESQIARNRRDRELQVTKNEEYKSQLLQFHAKRLSEQEQQRNTIAAARNKINLYRDTNALNIALRSNRPVGPRKSLILALAGMLGLMGGVMLAFIAEFLAKVRAQQTVRD